MRWGAILGAVAILCAAAPAWAQNKIGVQVSATTDDDATGKQIAFHLRDEIRKSGTFREAFSDKDSGFHLRLVTLPIENRAGLTVYSYTITMVNRDGFDYFLTTYTGYCGSDRVKSCADKMLSGLGESLEELRELLRRPPT